MVLDLGAGGGLSTVTFQALASSASTPGGPPFILAIDASSVMLTAACSKVAAVAGARPNPVVSATDGFSMARVDLLLADMGQPLPLRKGIADGVLSVSALQWLLDAREALPGASQPVPEVPGGPGEPRPGHASSVPCRGLRSDNAGPCAGGGEAGATDAESADLTRHQVRVHRLFQSLRSVATQSARLAFQFYPPKGDPGFGARSLLTAARAAGFAAEVFLDYPHNNGAKKWVLVAKPPSDEEPCIRAEERSCPCVGAGKLSRRHRMQGSACWTDDAWCALCWPVVMARCALLGTADFPLCTEEGMAAILARAEQRHIDVALRLARCGRRLRSANDPGAGAVRRRLEQELQPLQRELAAVLAAALDGPSVGGAELEAHLMASGSTGDVPSLKRVRPEDAETDPLVQSTTREQAAAPLGKAELRSAIMGRLTEVLEILHTPPSERWTAPPPPLTSEHATQTIESLGS